MGIDIVADTEDDEARDFSRDEIEDAVRGRWPEAQPTWDVSGETCSWNVLVGEYVRCFVQFHRPNSVSAKNWENIGAEAAVWLRHLVGPEPRVFVVNASGGAMAWVEPESTEAEVQSTLDRWNGYE